MRGQLKSPFQQRGAICCWLTRCSLPVLQQDLAVICSSPAPLILNSVSGSLPLPVRSVIPPSQPRRNVSRERKLREALNDWRGWDTPADSKQAISLHFSQRRDAAKINLFPQKASIFTQLHFPMRKSVDFQQIPSTALPGRLQSPLCSRWKG